MLYWILFSYSERSLKVGVLISAILYGEELRYELTDLILFCFAAKYDAKVSVNDIVIKAVAIALKNVPEANGKSFPVNHLLLFLIGCKKNGLTEHQKMLSFS